MNKYTKALVSTAGVLLVTYAVFGRFEIALERNAANSNDVFSIHNVIFTSITLIGVYFVYHMYKK